MGNPTPRAAWYRLDERCVWAMLVGTALWATAGCTPLFMDPYRSNASAPQRAGFATKVGLGELARSRPYSAALELREALRESPNSIPAKINLANVLLQTGEYTEAYQLVAPLPRDITAVKTFWAAYEAARGDSLAAGRAYERLAFEVLQQPQNERLDPTDERLRRASALYSLAYVSFLEGGDYLAARSSLESSFALLQSPEKADLLLALHVREGALGCAKELAADSYTSSQPEVLGAVEIVKAIELLSQGEQLPESLGKAPFIDREGYEISLLRAYVRGDTTNRSPEQLRRWLPPQLFVKQDAVQPQ